MPYSYSSIDEFTVGFDFQKEWIEGWSILLVIAFFLAGVAGGVFLISLLVGWKVGLVVGPAIVAISGVAFLFHLGRPLRFWRVFWRPQSAWISRGTFFIFLFAIFGLASYLTNNVVLMAIAAFFAFCLIIYTGFVMAASSAIPFWNNPLLPVLFLSVSLLSGASLAEAVHSFLPQVAMNIELLVALGLWLGVITAVLLLIYLWVNKSAGVGAKEATLFLAAGHFSWVFYFGVVLLGILIPLAIFIPAYFIQVPLILLAIAGICELAGSFVLRYSLLKAGIYPPVA